MFSLEILKLYSQLAGVANLELLLRQLALQQHISSDSSILVTINLLESDNFFFFCSSSLKIDNFQLVIKKIEILKLR